ncbi:MAG: mechanosensitive ion channel family protein [Selenomonadaceae bacterium]|nr:mechanosensitive ion channel family protein [Selenomonadaceae bacterium]
MPNIDLSNIDWTYYIELLTLPACILAAALIIGIALNRFINQHIKQHLSDEVTLTKVFFNALKGVPISFCLVAGLYWIVNTIAFTPTLTKIFSYILFTINIYTVTRVIARTASGMVDFYVNRPESSLPKNTLLNNILSFIIYAMGIIIVLQYCDISIAPIITAMGVGGMAMALGMQETLANIFSGVQLIISKQLRLNDFIMLNTGEQGRVTDITWRYTTIQSIMGNVIVIPNKSIAAAIITNYNLPQKDITIKIPIGVAYDSDLEQVEQVTLEVANKVMEDATETSSIPPKILFHTFGDSSIDFDVLLHSTRFDNQVDLRHNFIKELTKRYREENIDIPYPIRTIVQQTSSANPVIQ